MLHNESYIGRWRYKSRQWRKVPGTNRRVPMRRDHQKEMIDERLHLRIIDDDTWTATRERLEQVHRFYTRTNDGKPKGRALPARANPYLFSSLLCCGVCGGKMVISGGSKDAYYRCEGHAKRGTCKNDLSVRESVVRTGLLDELRHRLASDQGISYARKRLAEKLGELTRERDGDVRERRQRLDKLTRQIDKLVDFIADGHGSAAVADKLKGLEREADGERRQLATLERQATDPVQLPLRPRAAPYRGRHRRPRAATPNLSRRSHRARPAAGQVLRRAERNPPPRASHATAPRRRLRRAG